MSVVRGGLLLFLPYGIIVISSSVAVRSSEMGVSVCLFVRSYISKNDTFKYHEIFCTSHLCPWLCPPLTTVLGLYIMYFRFCRRRHTFADNALYGTWLRGRIVKVTHQWAAPEPKSWCLRLFLFLWF